LGFGIHLDSKSFIPVVGDSALKQYLRDTDGRPISCPEGVLYLRPISLQGQAVMNEAGQYFKTFLIQRTIIKIQIFGKAYSAMNQSNRRAPHKDQAVRIGGSENDFENLVLKIFPEKVFLKGAEGLRIPGFDLRDIKHWS
jgi:hypothetical protein